MYAKPVYEEVVVAHPAPAKPAHDDVWGSYQASWGKATATTGATAKPAAFTGGESSWKPATFQPFDVSKYLLTSRTANRKYGTPGATATNGGGKHWWEGQGSGQASGEQPWWELMAQGMPDGSPATPEAHAPAAHYKPARKPYVPRSTYAKPWSPSVKWQPAPVREYWWQK